MQLPVEAGKNCSTNAPPTDVFKIGIDRTKVQQAVHAVQHGVDGTHCIALLHKILLPSHQFLGDFTVCRIYAKPAHPADTFPVLPRSSPHDKNTFLCFVHASPGNSSGLSRSENLIRHDWITSRKHIPDQFFRNRPFAFTALSPHMSNACRSSEPRQRKPGTKGFRISGRYRLPIHAVNFCARLFGGVSLRCHQTVHSVARMQENPSTEASWVRSVAVILYVRLPSKVLRRKQCCSCLWYDPCIKLNLRSSSLICRI